MPTEAKIYKLCPMKAVPSFWPSDQNVFDEPRRETLVLGAFIYYVSAGIPLPIEVPFRSRRLKAAPYDQHVNTLEIIPSMLRVAKNYRK